MYKDHTHKIYFSTNSGGRSTQPSTPDPNHYIAGPSQTAVSLESVNPNPAPSIRAMQGITPNTGRSQDYMVAHMVVQRRELEKNNVNRVNNPNSANKARAPP